MCIPAEPALDVPSFHSPVARYDVFDSRGKQVPVVREACREGRAIVKCVWWFALGELQLPPKGIDLLPLRKDTLLFLGKIDGRHILGLLASAIEGTDLLYGVL